MWLSASVFLAYTGACFWGGVVDQRWSSLAAYWAGAVVLQWACNWWALSRRCERSSAQALAGRAAIDTVGPWTWLFGATIVALQLFPGFKCVFADVLGYYVVSDRANRALSSLLTARRGDKSTFLVQLESNPALFINQLTPDNFDAMFSEGRGITPLIDRTDPNTAPTLDALRQLTLVRDQVGQAMWYIYVGVLVTAMVDLSLAEYTCSSRTDAPSTTPPPPPPPTTYVATPHVEGQPSTSPQVPEPAPLG